MKKTLLSLLAATVLASCSVPLQTTVYVNPQASHPAQPAVPREDNSFQLFYDQLSSSGNWFDYPGYGYVWQPNVGQDFRPYATNGHWVFSDAGWTWVSGYSWGWAAFHYGRWFYENNYGWLWLPGHEWAPAWVTWGHSGDFYGWAPIAPNVNIATGNWSPPSESWNFVPAQHITKPDVVNYTVVHNNNTTVINNIVKNVTIINNVNKSVNNTYITNNNTTNNNTTNNKVVNNTVTYNRGPEVKEVENVTNVKVQKINIVENNKASTTVINNNNLVIYRPVIKSAEEQTKGNIKPKPGQVKSFPPQKPDNQ